MVASQGNLRMTEASGPVAYLTGDYPKVSHTFTLREVQAVRAAGDVALHHHTARVRVELTSDEAEQRRLSGAVRRDERRTFPERKTERHPLEEGLRPIAEAEAGDLEDRHGRGSIPDGPSSSIIDAMRGLRRARG